MDAKASACSRLLRISVAMVLALVGLASMAAGASAEEFKSPGTPEKLTVIKAGTGSGTVTSDPVGANGFAPKDVAAKEAGDGAPASSRPGPLSTVGLSGPDPGSPRGPFALRLLSSPATT